MKSSAKTSQNPGHEKAHTMCMFHSNAWAPDLTSQVISGKHSHAAIPKLRHIPTQGINCWPRHPRNAPDGNQQTLLRNCTSGAGPSKQQALSQCQKPTCGQNRQANLCGLRDPSTRSNKQIVAAFHNKTSQEKNVDPQ